MCRVHINECRRNTQSIPFFLPCLLHCRYSLEGSTSDNWTSKGSSLNRFTAIAITDYRVGNASWIIRYDLVQFSSGSGSVAPGHYSSHPTTTNSKGAASGFRIKSETGPTRFGRTARNEAPMARGTRNRGGS